MPEDVKEDIEVEFEEVDVEVEASKSEEFKEKAEKLKAKAEARNEANKEKLDETLNKSKDVAGKVGENLSKTIDDAIIAMKTLQSNFDTKYQGYKETAITNKITIDLAESKDFYYLQAYLAGIAKEDISIEATNNSVTIKACFENIMKKIESTEEDPATLIVSGIKEGGAERTVSLGADIVKEEITAKHDNGILFVTIPKREIPTTKIDIE
ncbi:Hsp20/alpha crystallin family protein [Methanobrevibacter sp.]|uniref:Hsp20/alpha crystallin family protein n=1 Tax=Methanobrevibacter sp. TaxID=66852 RepID=UPI0025E86E9F|nr:Hsp20/alpha crystallin family protein [Methanobrevibacter sp.]MBQ2961863.1 Hsp20/alpha crystallin family protein [Methanobrevibacter sp.]